MNSNEQPQPSDPPGTDPLSYDLDADDFITAVSDGWDDFALANGSPQATAAAVVGTSLWDHVHDRETRYFLQRLLRRARQTGELRLPFCCHAPHVSRVLDFRADSLGAGRLRIATLTTAQHSFDPPMTLLDHAATRGDEYLTICSWCNRACVAGTWEALDVVALKHALFVSRMPQLTHGICGDCRTVFEDEVG